MGKGFLISAKKKSNKNQLTSVLSFVVFHTGKPRIAHLYTTLLISFFLDWRIRRKSEAACAVLWVNDDVRRYDFIGDQYKSGRNQKNSLNDKLKKILKVDRSCFLPNFW